jgi:iron(III) transport system ATP-binding protein
VMVRCEGARLSVGAETAISVRQHDIKLFPAEAPATMENALPATVVRNVFLGSTRDYMVEAADGTQLRVIAPPAEDIAPGSKVLVYLPPERCRALVG